MNWFEPLNYTDSNHVEASETKLQFYAGWFANPIYINGKYPNIMRQKVKSVHILLCQVNLHSIATNICHFDSSSRVASHHVLMTTFFSSEKFRAKSKQCYVFFFFFSLILSITFF